MLVIRKEQMQSFGSSGRRVIYACPAKDDWIEFQLVDTQGRPVPGARYEIRLTDGCVVTGSLDSQGLVRYDHIPPGQCTITFPELDTEAWEAG